ncbi:uncharacterized protein LOC135158103 [Lytechinus pictus]|uniref:uncharacterized protein LOC135158103 n=1 Tax=Lytechinus pictus TaxID=7653 RepID=UPI0030B9C4F0
MVSDSFLKTCAFKKMDVADILRRDQDGERIIKELTSGKVSLKTRCKMVRILVSDLIVNHGTHPSTDVKIGLAWSIVTQFPTLRDQEGEGYEAFFTKSRDRHSATGYIEERLRNVRKRMPKQASTMKDQPTDQGSGEPPAEDKDSTISEDEAAEMCRWLQHNVQPVKTVQDYMAATSQKRIRDIHRTLFGKGVAESLSMKWTEEMAKKIKQYAQMQRSSPLLEELCAGIDTGNPQSALHLLPLFLPPGRTTNKHGKCRISSSEEALRSFIDVQPIGTNLPSYLGEVLEAGDRPQPYVLILGGRLQPSESFVVIEGHSIKTQSVLAAVDVCFKALYTLDINYQRQCATSWEFLQKYVYGIKDGKGKEMTSPGVRSLRAFLDNVPSC